MSDYYAQPYNLDAAGFYFDDGDTFADGVMAARDRFGQPVEEFDIMYVGADALTANLFSALGVSQATIGAFCDHVDNWDDNQKLTLIFAVGDCGYAFTLGVDNPDDLDVDIYHGMTMCELAEDFVAEGLFGDIPERLSYYLDYDAIARDLACDYTETDIAGVRYVYRCG